MLRVAGAPETRTQRARSTTLWLPDAAICDASASQLWHLDDVAPVQTHIAIAERVGRVRGANVPAWLDPRVTKHLDPIDREQVDDIVCTTATRTILDRAVDLDVDALEALFASAVRLRLTSTSFLARRFGALGSHRAGNATVRRLLTRVERVGVAESHLEIRFARLLARHRVGGFVRQHAVSVDGRTYRLDHAWLGLKVAVETEGFRWHGNVLRWKHDRRRIAALEALGWRVVLVTWDDVVRRPEETIARVRLALAQSAAAADLARAV